MFTFHAPKRGTCKGQVKNKLPQAIFAELFLKNSPGSYIIIYLHLSLSMGFCAAISNS